MIFRTISVRLLESRPPLAQENTLRLPPPTPKKWISYFGESPQSRATRLRTHPDHMVHVDHIKTTLRIKGSHAATIFSHLLQTGLWDDNALPHIIQFQALRNDQYPTFESAIPAYIAYRDDLTPVTKAWVSLVVGALPLAPIQPQFETDLYEWIRLATVKNGVSQTNLPLFLKRYEIELKESLHAADTMGRFCNDDSPLLNRLIQLIIRAFSEARPDWKSLQTAPSIATALRDRDAHLQHQKTRLLADWDTLIAQLIKYTAWSAAEAREFVLRYPRPTSILKAG